MEAIDLVYLRQALVVQEGVMSTKDEKEAQKKVVAARIKQRMDDLEHMTQEILSEKTGIDQAQLSRYIGADSMPSGHTLITLAQALECTAGHLLGLEIVPKVVTDPLSGLPADERSVVETYRAERIILERKVINEKINEYAEPFRSEIERLIRALQTTGKIDSRRDKP